MWPAALDARLRSVVVGACPAVLFVAVFALPIAGCGGTTDDRPATWTFISAAIMEPSCATANCHSAIAARASVDLSDSVVGYRSLLTRQFVISAMAAPSDTPEQRRDRSEILHLMRAQGNLRMPPDMPVPEVDIALIERWILLGATED